MSAEFCPTSSQPIDPSLRLLGHEGCLSKVAAFNSDIFNLSDERKTQYFFMHGSEVQYTQVCGFLERGFEVAKPVVSQGNPPPYYCAVGCIGGGL